MSSTSDVVTLMKAAMEKHNLHRVEDLAHRLGVTRTYTSLILNHRRIPSAKFVASVQRLVNMAPSLSEDAGPEYLALNVREIEDLLSHHVGDLPKQKGKAKIFYISIIRKLLHALEVKTNAAS